MNRKFSKSLLKRAVRLYADGLTFLQVSDKTGVSVPYLKSLVKIAGIVTRPAGFQIGNQSRKNKPHSDETKTKISLAHKRSGHKPSALAIELGQPKTLIARLGKSGKKRTAEEILFLRYIRTADQRLLEFKLDQNEFSRLIYSDCVYCGASPSYRRVNRTIGLSCNGIDRIDNSTGYVKTNCASACPTCNRMKAAMSHIDFVEHCKKIVNKANL